MKKQLTCRNVEKPKSGRAEEHLGKPQGAFFMPCGREKGESDAENADIIRFRHESV
jgi:ubiquitin